MRGETLERLRRRATRKWIPALGRGVVGAADGWMRGRRLLSTARDTRDEEFRGAGMRFLMPKTSRARTLASTRLLLHLTANTAAPGHYHVPYLHATDMPQMSSTGVRSVEEDRPSRSHACRRPTPSASSRSLAGRTVRRLRGLARPGRVS